MKSKRLLRDWLFAVFMASNFFLSAHVPDKVSNLGLHQADLKPKELQQNVVQLVRGGGGHGGGHSFGGGGGRSFRGGRGGFGSGRGSSRVSSGATRIRPSATSSSTTRPAVATQTSRPTVSVGSGSAARPSVGQTGRGNRGGRRGGRWGGHRGRGWGRGGYWGYPGFAFGFGFGLGIGIGFGYWGPYFYNPLAPFWGPQLAFGWGGYYYPLYGCWYYGNSWFYPWNSCWFYPNYGCWYYPNTGITVYYEPKKADRYAIVDNDADQDSFFALYYREQNGKEYNLYGVGGVKKVFAHETVKVVLPSYGKPEDFVVIVDRNMDHLKETLVQDEKGNLVTDRTVSDSRPRKIKDVDLEVKTVDKNTPELVKIRQDVHTKKDDLFKIEQRTKDQETKDKIKNESPVDNGGRQGRNETTVAG